MEWKRFSGRSLTVVLAAVPLWGQSTAPETALGESKARDSTEYTVSLLAPLTTKFSRKGDLVSAKVLQPAEYQGAILEGEVDEVHPGAGSGRRAGIRFEMHTLHFAGNAAPVSATFVQLTSSKKRVNLDEDGLAVEAEQDQEPRSGGKFTSVLRRSGRGGDARKSGSPAGLVRLTARGPNLSLAVGTELVLRVEPRQE